MICQKDLVVLYAERAMFATQYFRFQENASFAGNLSNAFRPFQGLTVFLGDFRHANKNPTRLLFCEPK